MNDYFPNDESFMLQKSGMVKQPFKVQGRPMDFNVAENEKFTDMVLDSTLQLIF